MKNQTKNQRFLVCLNRRSHLNKRGWIKIVEAVVAILLIVVVLLIVLNQGYIGKKDISSQVYDIEIAVLREIQLNDALRDDILNTNTPAEWDNIPETIKDKINSRIPNYLECKAKICWLNEDCALEAPPKKDVYAEAAVITTTLETPQESQLKQLKLFCWGK